MWGCVSVLFKEQAGGAVAVWIAHRLAMLANTPWATSRMKWRHRNLQIQFSFIFRRFAMAFSEKMDSIDFRQVPAILSLVITGLSYETPAR